MQKAKSNSKSALPRRAIEISLVIAAFLLIIVSLAYDSQILQFIAGHRTPQLDVFMAFMTNRGLFFLTLAVGLYLIYLRQYKLMVLILLAVASSMEIGFVLKKVIMRPRPFWTEALSTINLVQTLGYSFPSLHATFCFTMWPFLRRILKYKWLRVFGMIAIITIVFSRAYVGVHYASDLFAGSIIGFVIGKIWLFAEEHYGIINNFIFHIKDKLELRRQIAHLVTGLVIVVLIKYNILNWQILLGILIFGLALSITAKNAKIPLIHKVLAFFEREKDIQAFPGKGSFYMVLGSFLAVVLFPKDIALASITIMSIGDAITTLIGTYFGHVKNPFNHNKHLEGTMLAIILSTLAAFNLVGFEKAFLGSAIGMIVESIPLKFLDQIIDDNILIPLVAGFVMLLI